MDYFFFFFFLLGIERLYFTQFIIYGLLRISLLEWLSLKMTAVCCCNIVCLSACIQVVLWWISCLAVLSICVTAWCIKMPLTLNKRNLLIERSGWSITPQHVCMVNTEDACTTRSLSCFWSLGITFSRPDIFTCPATTEVRLSRSYLVWAVLCLIVPSFIISSSSTVLPRCFSLDILHTLVLLHFIASTMCLTKWQWGFIFLLIYLSVD